MRRERVGEVREAVEHEHRAIPRRSGGGCLGRSLGRSLRGLSCVALAHRIFLLRRNDAHLHGGIDERVERALDRRAVPTAAAAGFPVIAVVVVDFCGVQREDGPQVLRVRQKGLWWRERGVGWVERDAQERTALCRDGVEEDRVRRGGRPGFYIISFFYFFRDRTKTYSLSVVASSARAPSVRAIVSA